MNLSGLAAFGAVPRFSQPLHVAQINLPSWDRVEAAFGGIFSRRYYANHGPLVTQLESEFSDLIGVRHAICVTNGTVALMVMCHALQLSGEVIVPAFTFPATLQALMWAGLTPVLCDVDPKTHVLTADLVKERITSRTSGILATHAWGRAANPEALAELAASRGLKLAFDACHGIACTDGMRMIGNFGEAESFSFHATKILNATEGGCITTNNDVLAARLRAARSFHCTNSDPPGVLRMNAKMSEAQAAFALLGLEDLSSNLEANRQRYLAYSAGLSGIAGIAPVYYDEAECNNYQYVNILVEESAAGLSRDDLFDLLAAENVYCRRHFFPGMHRTAPFDRLPSVVGGAFPGTEWLSARILQLPNGQDIPLSAVTGVCELLQILLKLAPAIRARKVGK